MRNQPVTRRLHVDPARTRVGFDISALWVLRRRGEFRDVEGSLSYEPDGVNAVIQVRIRVASVDMPNAEHVKLLLSADFFDAGQYPWIEFRSEPFALGKAERLDLPGTLQLHGITQRVQFSAETSRCLLDAKSSCEVEVSGTLQRSQFGMTEYRHTLADEVNLRIFATMHAKETRRSAYPTSKRAAAPPGRPLSRR